MRAPSVDRLVKELRLSREQAKAIREPAAAHSSGGAALEELVLAKHPEPARYVASMYSSPWGSSHWRTTVALHAMNLVAGTYGVEGLGGDLDDYRAPPYEYLNAGDTYTATLIYTRRSDSLSIGAWGDIAERLE